MLPETDTLNDRFADTEPVAVDENEFMEFDGLNDCRVERVAKRLAKAVEEFKGERVANRLTKLVEDSEGTLVRLGSALANALKDSKGALVTLGCNVTVCTADRVGVDDTD